MAIFSVRKITNCSSDLKIIKLNYKDPVNLFQGDSVFINTESAEDLRVLSKIMLDKSFIVGNVQPIESSGGSSASQSFVQAIDFFSVRTAGAGYSSGDRIRRLTRYDISNVLPPSVVSFYNLTTNSDLSLSVSLADLIPVVEDTSSSINNSTVTQSLVDTDPPLIISVPSLTTKMVLYIESGSVRRYSDGKTPSAVNGILHKKGSVVEFTGNDVYSTRIHGTLPTPSKVHFEFFK